MKYPFTPSTDADSSTDGWAQTRACAAAPAWCAPPGNTAPQKYIAHALRALKVLPGAVDSLYVSYAGALFSSVAEELHDRKRLAQCPEDEARALAQYQVGQHLLSVSDKGRRRADFVLRNSRFSLDVARGPRIPLAYVQIASSFLVQSGVQTALDAVRFVVNSLGAVRGDETLSRIDLCVDFVPSLPLYRWPDDLWITRASKIDTHAVRGRFTGWSFGLGADLSARLYDKRFEVETVSEKVYMYDLWESAGVVAADPVWRLEFQLSRPVLKELGVRTVADATSRLADLWSYCCTKWLSLRVPVPDRNRARWPLAQLWTDLVGAAWSGSLAPAVRSRSSDAIGTRSAMQLFRGVLASCMAVRGITDYGEGLGTFLHDCDQLCMADGLTFAQSVQHRARLKAAKLCTVNNREARGIDAGGIESAASAYRQVRISGSSAGSSDISDGCAL